MDCWCVSKSCVSETVTGRWGEMSTNALMDTSEPSTQKPFFSKVPDWDNLMPSVENCEASRELSDSIKLIQRLSKASLFSQHPRDLIAAITKFPFLFVFLLNWLNSIQSRRKPSHQSFVNESSLEPAARLSQFQNILRGGKSDVPKRRSCKSESKENNFSRAQLFGVTFLR